MISDDLIKVNKLSAKKPIKSDKKKRGTTALLNQDLRFSINSDSAIGTNENPLKIV
jgi:hypothetical protein